MKRSGMRNGLVISVALHVVVVLLAMLGLPSFFEEPEPMETAMVVDLVELAERTAAPPPRARVPDPPKPEPKEEPKPELKPETKPDLAPEPKQKQKPTPAPKPVERIPDPVPEPKKAEPPKPEPKKAEPPKKKPKDDDPFKDLMKNVEKFREKPKPETQDKSAASSPDKPKVLNAPLSDRPTMMEIDAIRAQIEQNWAVDTGAKGVESMVIPLKVRIAPDGAVISVDVIDTGRYGSDSSYRAVAESARRAVYRSQPIRYPVQKYETFKSMEIVFRPQSRM